MTVVVVEDNPRVADLYVDALADLGHAALAFWDGKSFLGALPALSAHLVILDRQLPGIDGLEIARQMRTVRPDVPILMISGNPPTQACAAVVDRVLGKPCTMDQFADAVTALLARAGRGAGMIPAER